MTPAQTSTAAVSVRAVPTTLLCTSNRFVVPLLLVSVRVPVTVRLPARSREATELAAPVQVKFAHVIVPATPAVIVGVVSVVTSELPLKLKLLAACTPPDVLLNVNVAVLAVIVVPPLLPMMPVVFEPMIVTVLEPNVIVFVFVLLKFNWLMVEAKLFEANVPDVTKRTVPAAITSASPWA